MDLVAQTRAAEVRQAARDLEFDLVGIAPAAPPPRMDACRDSLERGWHATMGWLARPDAVAKRADPAQVLPGARSIVCVAKSYHRDDPAADDHRPRGRIARYARGDDYHEVLPPRLEQLAERLRAMGGEAKAYSDTGPVSEVAHAARAGLGWVGKNTLLLSRNAGSWLLLGEVLTTLELAPDTPAGDHCGSCTACLDACPTDAFPAPHRLDARRCISFLTIENKGPIPTELREGLGSWIFGCDICQEVCPWSRRFPLASDEPAFAPRPGLAAPDLLGLLALDDAAFRERFRGSPILRSKRRGLLRNVCVALGNLGDRGAVEGLAAALGDSEPLVRGHAAWALGRIGGDAAWAALEGALVREQDSAVVEELIQALAGKPA